MNSRKPIDPLLQTHYEVLGVKQNCSQQEIREAFVTLSKKIHPDVNKNDPRCHESFLKLNEAYSILSKPNKRQLYDSALVTQRYGTTDSAAFSSSWVETNAPYGRTVEWRDETLWGSRDSSKDKFYKDKPYYGIKGVNRISNGAIAAGCVVFMLAGAVFHFVVVKKSSDKAIEVLNNRDKESNNWYMETRRKAMSMTTHAQVDRLSKEWSLNADDAKKN